LKTLHQGQLHSTSPVRQGLEGPRPADRHRHREHSAPMDMKGRPLVRRRPWRGRAPLAAPPRRPAARTLRAGPGAPPRPRHPRPPHLRASPRRFSMAWCPWSLWSLWSLRPVTLRPWSFWPHLLPPAQIGEARKAYHPSTSDHGSSLQVHVPCGFKLEPSSARQAHTGISVLTHETRPHPWGKRWGGDQTQRRHAGPGSPAAQAADARAAR